MKNDVMRSFAKNLKSQNADLSAKIASSETQMGQLESQLAKLEQSQLRRSFTKTYNEASSLFKKDRLLNEDITFLKTAAAALQEQLKECQNVDKEIRIIALDEIKDADELDAFFDEVTEGKKYN
eukprot:gene10547-biopygen7701